MTKAELIAELATSNPHLRQGDVELIVLTVFDQISTALARGDRVELRGFGSFVTRQRDARIGHNPRTGETVSVKAKAVPFFKAGRELRDRLNRPHEGRGGQPAVAVDRWPSPTQSGQRGSSASTGAAKK